MLDAQALLTPTTVGTMAGATCGVVAVSVVFRKVFKINHPIVPLVTSLVVTLALAQTTNSLGTLIDWLIAVLNGCILFCAAVGANETAADATTPKPAGAGMQQGGAPMPWIKSFFDR